MVGRTHGENGGGEGMNVSQKLAKDFFADLCRICFFIFLIGILLAWLGLGTDTVLWRVGIVGTSLLGLAWFVIDRQEILRWIRGPWFRPTLVSRVSVFWLVCFLGIMNY